MEQNYRINQLQQLLAEFPDDPFSLYSLALEYRKVNMARAVSHFKNLMRNHPNYLPAYYQAAALFAETGDLKTAEATYAAGIALAHKQKQPKTARELQAALDLLID